jgi:trigger factor
MKVTVNSKKGLKTNLEVFIDKKTMREKIDIRLEELSKTVNLKGFRPGKVPVDIIRKQFGKVIYSEVLEKVLKETSSKAIEEKKIKIAGLPKLELKSHGEEKDLKYTLDIEELPKVKLQPIDKIRFTEYEINISEKEIKKRIDDIAKNQNNFKDKKENDIAKKGDLVAFDYVATINNKIFEGGEGKNTQLVIGKDLFIKGFDEQLLGVKRNQEKLINAILPENYPKKEFANANAVFKCKILNIKEPVETIINDDFAKNLGAKNLNDLKDLVSKQIQNQYKMTLDSLSKENILNQIEKIHDINLPDNLVQEEIKLISKDLKEEELEKNKDETKRIAKRRIKLGLILNELGENNKLKVEEQEIKNEIQKQVQSMPGQQKQILDYYQKNPSAAASLKGSLYEEKIINLIKEKSNKVKKKVSSEEAEKIIKDSNEIRKTSDSSTKKTPKKAGKKTSSAKKIRKK